MKKNFLITTGGSGGHVIPATIFFEHLSKDNNILISTDKRGMKYLDENLYKCEIINTPKLNNIFFLPFNLLKILFLLFKSLFLLIEKKIDKVFSTGGYMSLPVILAARLLQIEIYLIEPNQVLGRANKFFLKSCKRIFCYDKNIKNLPNIFENKVVVINPLVRENIYKSKPINKNKDKLTILVVGGSQGAEIFDRNLKEIMVNISKKIPIRIIQQTSEKNIYFLRNFYTKNNVDNKIFSFDKNFSNNILQVDFCITRAGASTMAELSTLNIPFIAVPLPTSKDNHQFANANFYKDRDCCWIIEQNSFEEKIEQSLEDILIKKSDYLTKKENLKKLNFQNSWINVNQKILRIINEN